VIFFDQLKKNDPTLRAVAVAIVLGLGILVAGLWWVQIVSAREYQANLEMQSFRTVRIPAVRGKILDRNGQVLAENRPVYNVSLYLEDLRKDFTKAANAEIATARKALKAQMDAEEKRLGRKLNREERKKFLLSSAERTGLSKRARYFVASNVVAEIGARLGLATTLSPTNFEKHYSSTLALPMPVFTNLNSLQIARFEEQSVNFNGVDIEMRSLRIYPHGTTASHVLGRVRSDNDSAEGEESYFSYRLPDYKGQVGIEGGYDRELRGRAGVKSVVINSLGYRETENIWESAEPGTNLTLTIDLLLQEKTERALQGVSGASTKGAAVVMDVQTGDILAMASSPTLDPNLWMQPLSESEWKRITDQMAEKNRATQENYAPGSIFKTITGLACLEAGVDPKAKMELVGSITVAHGARPIRDDGRVGMYDFERALIESSNAYFISNGVYRAGVERIVQLGRQLHLAERAGIQTRQETAGKFPDLHQVTSSGWHIGDTANLCIGQGYIAVTPLQMAVMAAALGNGGKVLWPRLVDRMQSQEPAYADRVLVYPKGVVRDQLRVSPQNLQIVRTAMLADVEGGGTGSKALVPGFHICGKTGTAQVQNQKGEVTANIVWFASFAPFENTRYAVVVMVELPRNAGSGGATCAPIGGRIYQALQEYEKRQNHSPTIARAE
jgi:penicillin-binding protein 2